MLFEELNLNPMLLKAVKGMGFIELTPIQEKCIPELRKGRDVVGQSSTGSGKTAAFGLPLMEKIEPGKPVQVLVLTPTRELCVQVAEALSEFGRHMRIKTTAIYGGVSLGPQMDAIKICEIVVGTPGRILDHISRRTLNFRNTRFLVLDEADKMFEMGFIEDVEEIIGNVPKDRQTMLFSATFSDQVYELVQKHLRNPIFLKSTIYVDKIFLKQVYYDVLPNHKFSLLVHLLKEKKEGVSLVFCATRREVDAVSRNLKANGVSAMAIHGGFTQNKRLSALKALKDERISALIATDVAARGLDIRNVSRVFNYDVPKTSGEYVHRIGRTARAGMTGEAITILCDRDYENFDRVLSDHSLEIREGLPIKFETVRFQRQEFEREQRFGERRHFGNRSYPRKDRGQGRFGAARKNASEGMREGEGHDGYSSERRVHSNPSNFHSRNNERRSDRNFRRPSHAQQ